MLTGLMDHWVPSHDAISRFWKTPFDTLRPLVERLCDEVAVNNFTFYTKWYSNGIKSALPFLRNVPEAMNVATDNAWGRRWLEFFHDRGMTVGAMLQCYTFQPGLLPREAVLGTWAGTRRATGLEGDNEIADPTWDGYPELLVQMIEEQLRLFPDFDAIFLEFEGIGAPGKGSRLWQMAQEAGPDSVEPALRAQWEESGFGGGDDAWTWSAPVQKLLRDSLATQLAAVDKLLDRIGFNGISGVVYHAMGYETPYVLDCLPGRDWWLLPWHYWGWGHKEPDETAQRQTDWCKRSFRERVEQGYKLCYIGNATLPTVRPDAITEMARHCMEIGAAGHIGMGDPIPQYGLRWHDATEQGVAAARRIYKDLFPGSR